MIGGLTRIRNESSIIKDTLDHMSTFCDFVIVYDDCSTDDTVSICESHPIVKTVIKGTTWSPNRMVEEYSNRHQLYLEVEKHLTDDDWFVYMDADERIEFDFTLLKTYTDVDAVYMKLFDFYITDSDKGLDYTHREWVGPEYRNISMIFRMGSATGWHHLDQRMCSTNRHNYIYCGKVKHYGKAISIDEWEKTCDYYGNNFPEPYKSKWLARKGKAIHTESDFGRELIKWGDIDNCNFLHKIH